MLNKIKETEYNSIQDLITELFKSELVFKVDSETKQDIYILNKSKVKNQSEHYQIEKTKKDKYKLKFIKE